MAAGGRRARRRAGARARAGAALLVGGLAVAAGGALPGAEAGRRRRRGPKVEGVVAARACAWAPDPAGGGGRLELSEVATSEVFTVSPKRRGWSASPEALVRAFAGARKPRNVALTAWPSGGAAGAGGAPRYLVGELVSAEPGPPAGSGLQLRLRMSDAQARASAPAALEAPAPGEGGPGFQAASCSLFLDAVAGSKVTQGAPAPGAQPPSPVGAWAACGGLNTAKCDKDEACFSCRSSGGQSYTCDRQSQWYWQCTPDTPGPRMPPPLPPAPAGPGVQDWTAVTMSSDGTKLAAAVRWGNIWTSTDSGGTWTERPVGSGKDMWEAIASSSDGTKLAAASKSFLGTGGSIWTSTDSGGTWTERTSGRGFVNETWTGIASSSDGTKLAALVGHYRGDVADGAEIWMSADAGETWRSPGGLRRSSPRASQPPPRRGRPEP